MASFEHFEDHLRKGDLYVFFNMADSLSPYQIHYETRQYMDKNDGKIPLKLGNEFFKFLKKDDGDKPVVVNGFIKRNLKLKDKMTYLPDEFSDEEIKDLSVVDRYRHFPDHLTEEDWNKIWTNGSWEVSMIRASEMTKIVREKHNAKFPGFHNVGKFGEYGGTDVAVAVPKNDTKYFINKEGAPDISGIIPEKLDNNMDLLRLYMQGRKIQGINEYTRLKISYDFSNVGRRKSLIKDSNFIINYDGELTVDGIDKDKLLLKKIDYMTSDWNKCRAIYFNTLKGKRLFKSVFPFVKKDRGTIPTETSKAIYNPENNPNKNSATIDRDGDVVKTKPITEDIVRKYINELFSQKLVQQLADKFKQEQPDLENKVINFYVDRFQQIKDSPKVQNKDITTYSWNELKKLIDINQPDEIQIEADDKELIYDQNNLKIYLANTKRACVKYGTGYKFCISARSQDNEYDLYRFGDHGVNENTIYFIIDDDRTKEQNNDGTFKDPYHLIVLMAKKHQLMKYDNKGNKLFEIRYVVTTANNIGNKEYLKFSNLTKDIPKLKGLDKLFPFVNPNPTEEKYSIIKNKYDDLFYKIYLNANITGMKWDISRGKTPYGNLNFLHEELPVINNIINNKPVFVYSLDVGEEQPLYGTFIDDKEVKKWAKYLRDDLDYEIEEQDIDEIKIEKHLPNDDPKFMEYIRNVKNIYLEYLNQKNQLNIPT